VIRRNGRRVTSLRNTLIGHAIAAPIILGGVSFVYFSRVHYTTPFQAAIIYPLPVVALDFAIVATLIERSYAMFATVLGTWLPFALIFVSTYLVGLYVTK
jgi:hypothetical protein